MFLARRGVIADQSTGFAHTIDSFSIDGRRRAGAAFMKVINQGRRICVAPDGFTRSRIQAMKGLLITLTLTGTAQGKHAPFGHGHTGKANADLGAPRDLAEVRLGHGFSRNTGVGRPAPVRPIAREGNAIGQEKNRHVSHGLRIMGLSRAEKLPFCQKHMWIR